MKSKIIGVTGNRKLPDDKIPFIREKLKEFLLPYQSRAILLTGLAEGVDQLAASTAMNLNIPYRAVLPFTPEQFLQDSILEGMDPKSSKAEEKAGQFQQYINNAQQVVILQMENSDKPYQQLGRYLIDQSDVLLAVWDGVRHYRPGSTSDILKMSINQKKALSVHALNITNNQWERW